ncbi:metallophosphoesterase family protein [Pseudooceanicola nanhaiensis]|uniref:metallophosphoesterase family protein n=1 Tax=Pseudooceanicola nanhaiensis TaxID=375761 RepID=UPI0035133377
MIRFLHASDLHLGKPFGAFPEEVRQRLRQARQDSIGALAKAARAGAASHVLLAGDTFDAETPTRATLRQAMNAMAGYDDLTWVLMPGNHDHLGAAEIWETLARERPGNVTLALDPVPMALAAGAMLLPAPCTTRNPGRDLTEWMDAADSGAAIRIGLAHGSIRDFRSVEEMGGEGGAVIAPDRAIRAELDYLGFGDWHGRIEVTPNTWYSGTPEPDSFKPHRPAGALLVSIAERGAPPEVTETQTGQINWTRLTLDLLESEDPAELLAGALPALATRDRTLIDIRATGRAGLAGHAALAQGIEDAAPDFLWAESNLSALAVTHEAGDLSLIDDRGAVRDAADALAAAADAGDATAAAALTRLYSYALEVK